MAANIDPAHLAVYRQLAARLDALPNGFPATPDGTELRVLAKLFTPEQAALAAQLRLTKETPAHIAERTGGDPKALRQQLKDMARAGLIAAARGEGGMVYGLMPFVVGIYEFQGQSIDRELAELVEAYFRQAFSAAVAHAPQVHRVIPVGESVPVDIEIQPYDSAAAIVDGMQAWGVLDCICRKQKALIGEPCEHPIDICMAFSSTPGAFDHSDAVRALSREEAHATLRRAADVGLVHTVNNTQEDVWYICNCCTCSCGVLRGIADLGIANVVARSPYLSCVDDEGCIGCEECLDFCQFDALELGADGTMTVIERRCVGCGVCVVHCSQEALSLVRRPAGEVKPPPRSDVEWRQARASARGINLRDVL